MWYLLIILDAYTMMSCDLPEVIPRSTREVHYMYIYIMIVFGLSSAYEEYHEAWLWIFYYWGSPGARAFVDHTMSTVTLWEYGWQP